MQRTVWKNMQHPDGEERGHCVNTKEPRMSPSPLAEQACASVAER